MLCIYLSFSHLVEDEFNKNHLDFRHIFQMCQKLKLFQFNAAIWFDILIFEPESKSSETKPP